MIDIELVCDECGNYLDYEVTYMNESIRIIVQPCDTCLSDLRQEGYDEGYEIGHDIGYDAGYEYGRDIGYDAGKEDVE